MSEAAASDPPTGGAVRSRLLSDDRLARRATRGDRRAFEAIFRRYHQDLYRFCLATTGNPQDAQDVLQNTMVKAMQALPGEQRQIKLKPWLYRVARNEAVETVRKRRDGAELDPEQTAATWEIAETAAARERLRRLFADLEELPERQRSALVMRELAGLDFAEIGAAFGSTAAVARQTLYEARLSLRQMEEGREMSCETVMRALSDGDGRVTRRRDLRAHLRSCASCRAFRDGIAERRGELAAIAPLPLALSAGLLNSLLGGEASLAAGAGTGAASAAGAGAAGTGTGAAGSLAGTVGAGAGKAVATSAIVKSAATVAVVATVGVSAADRGGLIDLPLTGGDKAAKSASEPAASSLRQRRESAAAASEPGSGAEEDRAPDGAGAKGKGPADAANGRAKRSGGPNRSSRGKSAAQSRGHPGRGKSQAGRRGGPQGMPPASSRGQQTSAARKAPQSSSSPGRSGASTGGPTPAPQPARAPKDEGTAVAPPAPPPAAPEPLESSKGSPGSKGAGAGQSESPEP